jgi:hypothetical protein
VDQFLQLNKTLAGVGGTSNYLQNKITYKKYKTKKVYLLVL